MNQRFTPLIYTILFVICGLFMSSHVKAAEINNPELKTAIEAFLKESGDTGDGDMPNWQRLDVPNPEDGDGWWVSFCDHPNGYINKNWGSEIVYIEVRYNQSSEHILCCGELKLENVPLLSSITLNANYLTKVIIDECSDLNSINLEIAVDYSEEDPKPNMDESIETDISITDCPLLNYFRGNFPSVHSFTWAGTGSEDANISLSAYNTINNFTLTDCGRTSVSLYASEFIGSIAVANCLDFSGFSIEAGEKNNNAVNILFSNNSNTSNSFSFFSMNIPLTTLPGIPSSVESLELECIGHNFSEPLDLSYLTNLNSLNSSNCGFSVFPQLSESITDLNLNWSDDYFSEVVDLKGLRSLKSLSLYGFTQFPDLPISIQSVTCNYGYEKGISGEVNLVGLSSLEELYCENNKITSILNIPSSLKRLSCANNEITRISISNPSTSLLSNLDCKYNKITDFPAQLPVSLEILYCNNNKISGVLDLSQLSFLSGLECDNNNIEEVKIHDNTFNSNNFIVRGNQIPISKLEELARGFDNLLNNQYPYLPQKLTDERIIFSGNTVDLSDQLIDDRLSCTWFDITNDIERLRYDLENAQRIDEINFNSYLTDGNKITDNTKIEETEPDVFLFKDKVKGKFLLGEIRAGSEYNDYATHYSLIYVENGVSNPEIVFEVKIDDNEYILPKNSETTVLWNSTFELRINPPVIPEGILYDKWEITYFDSSQPGGNIISERINKGEAFNIDLSLDNYSNTPTKISVLELKLYNLDADVETYSYAYAPYRQTFIQDNNPILWFEEKINEDEYIEIENNITTTQEKGNKVFLRMGALIKEGIIQARSTPVPSSLSWEIEYTITDGGDPIRSGRMNTEQYYDFNEGNPHQDPGIYPYSVKRLFVYNTITVDNVLLRNTPAPSDAIVYDFTDNPYNHTIIIKGDGTEPEPEPEVGLQFAVSINDNSSFSDVPNLHTTRVEEGNSVYLDIRTVTRNIIFNKWKIEYTTAAGLNVSSDWQTTGSPYHFNNGSPHTIPGTYVYTVNQLQLQGESQVYTYDYTNNPYTNTIVITKKGTEPEPGPDPEPEFPPVVPEIPDPDPNPDAWIIIDPLAPLCYEEGQFLITIKTNTTDSLYYAICYPQTSLDAGFEKDSIFKVLPTDGVIPVAVNNAIPKGFYYGYLVIWSKTRQETELYPFRIEVKDYVRITKQPEAVTQRCEGDGFVLSVETEGEVLAYQWFRNNEPIPGATTSSYEAVLSPETIGTYYVKIEGYCNIETSQDANVGMNTLQILMKWDDVMYIQNTDNLYTSFQWYKDGAPIDKYGKSVYYTNSDGLLGTYYVMATRKDGTVDISCPKTFGTKTRSTSGQVYPNPVARNETLTVHLDSYIGNISENARIEILDISGRLVFNQKVNTATTHIPVTFPTGSYVVKITTSEGRITTQILIVK